MKNISFLINLFFLPDQKSQDKNENILRKKTSIEMK